MYAIKCPLCDAIMIPTWIDTAGCHYRCSCGFDSDNWAKVYYTTQIDYTASPKADEVNHGNNKLVDRYVMRQ